MDLQRHHSQASIVVPFDKPDLTMSDLVQDLSKYRQYINL